MKINLVEGENRKCYIADFLEKECSENEVKRIIEKLGDLENHHVTNLLKSQKLKKLSDNLYEIRMNINKIAFRFFGGFKDGTFHLVHAIKKKRQSLALKDMNTAKIRVKMFLS